MFFHSHASLLNTIQVIQDTNQEEETMQNSKSEDRSAADTISKDVADAKISDQVVKYFLNSNLLTESDLATPG